MPKDIYQNYLNKLCNIYHDKESTESSYYPILKGFIEDYISTKKGFVNIIVQPKKTEAGIPDFILKSEEGKIIGYVEAKEPDKNLYNLDKNDTEQIERYKDVLPNLILTNFVDFILFRNGEKISEVRIAQPVSIRLNKPVLQKTEEFKGLLDTFFSFSIPKTTTAEALAEELAKRTKLLRHFVFEELKDNPSSSVHQFYTAFKEELITSLTIDNFSDMYSQTISYGLFSARIRARENGFLRTTAYQYIPSTIPLLRSLFHYITGPDLPESLEWIIDDITDVLNSTDIKSILKDFHTTKWTDDPVIHFYETFLNVYNPEERKRRGVYYTPAPVVSFIVYSIHELLKKEFNKTDGLADRTVTLLDPASGTLTFPATAIRLAKTELENKNKGGIFPQLVKEHILRNFYAFDLMVAPYAIGHLKIAIVLDDLGYNLGKDERFNLYLTNTLELKDIKQIDLPLVSDLAKEGIAAKKVKDKIPILVILGNPPYSVSSENKSEFIEDLMKDWKDAVKGERNIQPLSDDYIKFLRFAQWKIEQGRVGIIGMITNNSYLSGLIHRGMRKSLLNSFDEIYILDLHGSSRIKERCPDGSKDENVFDIQQGVAIILAIKKHRRVNKKPSIYHYDLLGTRDTKYKYLEGNNVTRTRWTELKPVEPYYFFVPKKLRGIKKYENFWPIKEIFEEFSSGVKTHRDHFLVGFSKEEVENRIRTFIGGLPDEIVMEGLKLTESEDFKISLARENVRKEDLKTNFYRYAYHPFDLRYIYFSPFVVTRPRLPFMKNLLKENIALSLMRKPIPSAPLTQIFVVNTIGDINFYGYQSYFFPLYLYKEKNPQGNPSVNSKSIKTKDYQRLSTTMLLFEPQVEYSLKKPNLSERFINALKSAFKKDFIPQGKGDGRKTFGPEDVFYYIYAILYSDSYRNRYEEFLKIDFPRVPFTEDFGLFRKISKLGERHISLHLLKASELETHKTKYPKQGTDKIEKVEYDRAKKKVYINKDQYFEGISEEIWEYHIGSYQVLPKWLKERKERKLTINDIEHFLKIVEAIRHTLKIQEEIDKVYLLIEKSLIEK
ncbi:MAG: type ISP restriction/modification enzyme [Nitrospirota bacterium]